MRRKARERVSHYGRERYRKTPEIRAKQAESFQKRYYTDDNYRARMIERAKRYLRTPKYRARAAKSAAARAGHPWVPGQTLMVQAMLEDEARCCAVCTSQTKLVVDHDHVTGLVRSLLCAGCNSAIGHARESAETLRALALYLEKHK